MNMSLRDKKILLMFMGIVLFVVGYLFGYKPQMEKAAQIEASNAPLQERLNELLDMAANKDFYVKETEEMQGKISDYCKEFPLTVREEDGIVLARNMETAMDMQITNVGLGTKEFISSLDGSTSEDLVNMPEETMSEQANEQTQTQIDEIEGTDSQAQEEQQEAVEAATEEAAAGSSVGPILFRTQDTLQFNCTYSSLKEAVGYLAGQSGRMTLDNVSASFDSTTGNLTGTMTVNLYSMIGAENTYTEPDAGSVSYGTKNIFGTIEKSSKEQKEKK